jgi:hypothetical protein
MVGQLFKHRRFGFQIIEVVWVTGQNKAMPSDPADNIVFYQYPGALDTQSLPLGLFNARFEPYTGPVPHEDIEKPNYIKR